MPARTAGDIVEQVKYELGDEVDDITPDTTYLRYLYAAYPEFNLKTGLSATLTLPPTHGVSVGNLASLDEKLLVLYTARTVLMGEMQRKARLNEGEHASPAGRVDTRRTASETAEVLGRVDMQIDMYENLKFFRPSSLVKLNLPGEL